MDYHSTMTTNSPAKILVVFALLFSVLSGCGGSDDTTAPEPEAVEETPVPEEEKDVDNESVEEKPRDDREIIITLVQAFLPSDEVPEAFVECWVDETLRMNGFTAEELKDLLLSGDQDQELDAFQGDVVFSCISDLSPEDFAAVLAAGILDEDEDSTEEDERPDFDENQTFPETEAPDLISSPALADEGIEIVISPGFTNGYLWSGDVSGTGMPPGIATAIFGCAGSFETVIANIFEACDFSQPLIAFIDDQGKFTATVDEPVPTSPDGTCLIVTTDPDNNPDTDDGPGAIVCSSDAPDQGFSEEIAADLLSSPEYADPGIEIVISPGLIDGYLWAGTISGNGFTPGEVVGAIGCGTTYETFFETFSFSCDWENPALLGVVQEDGSFNSGEIGPAPTFAEGTCLLIGTDPDNNIETDDGEGVIVCTR